MCILTYIYEHAHMYICVNLSVYVCSCMYSYMHVYMCTDVYILIAYMWNIYKLGIYIYIFLQILKYNHG